MTPRAKLIDEINSAIGQKDYQQAVIYLDQLAEIDGETTKILDYKFDLLIQLGKYQEALEIIPKLEAISVRESPWNCLKAAETHIKLRNHDEALAWIEKAVTERAFRRVAVFDLPVYDPLRPDERFTRLIVKAQENIGLGKALPDFTVTLLNGQSVTLSDLRGKVVLIDFWSTSCPPCVKEIPCLKNLYAQFNQQGFEIIGISLDEDREKLGAFVLENDLQWKIVCSGKSLLDDTVQLYRVNAQPSIWLADRQGILRYFDVRGDRLGQAVQALL